MDLEAVRSQLQAERRRPLDEGDWVEVLPKVTRYGSTAHGWAVVSFSELTAADADAAIAEQVAHFEALGQEFEWTVYGVDGPPDLRERLERRGFAIGPCEAVMVYDLHQGLETFRPAHEIRVERIATLDRIEDYRKVAEAVFGKDFGRTCRELADAFAAGSTDHFAYVAYDEGQPVSAGRLYTSRNSAFGGLYGGGTLPSYRGRGFYQAVVARRAQEAARLGARYLRVDALPTSRPILERLGFTHIADLWPCVYRVGHRSA